jgi:trk system potassium uptake protein TrkH
MTSTPTDDPARPEPTETLSDQVRRARSRRHLDEDLALLDEAPTSTERSLLRQRVRSPWILILGFAIMVAAGTTLLKLPVAAAPGTTISWSDAFFTSVSAITVTGLTVRNTALDFSFAGQIFILILLQVGGVGFITSSVLFFRLVRRRVTLGTRFMIQGDVGSSALSGVVPLAVYVLGVTIAIELAGTLLLWLRWRTELPDGQAFWYALFQAVSTYCNAGFDLFGATDRGAVYGFGGDWYSLLVLSLLVILGGFGITIYYDLLSVRRTHLLSLNTRFALTFSFVLSIGGLIFLMIDPRLHSTAAVDYSLNERTWQALFTSIAARTAGVTVMPLSALSEGSQLVLMLLMFIGASPASMAGGVSTTTVAVLLTAARNTVIGSDPSIFGRTLPRETVAKAVAIMTISTLLVVFVTLLLTIYYQGGIFALGFEVVSAFSNTGYSLDQTARLDDFGRFLVAFTMFWGRLGPLTIVVALAQRDQPALIRYPEEAVILG